MLKKNYSYQCDIKCGPWDSSQYHPEACKKCKFTDSNPDPLIQGQGVWVGEKGEKHWALD